MTINTDSMSDLQFYSEQLSTEGFSSTLSVLNELFNRSLNVIKGFTSKNTEGEIADLSKKEKAFLKVTDTINFLQLREMQAFVPGGFTSKYLDYHVSLKEQVEFSKGLQNGILQPYVSALGQMVSDRKSILRTDTGERRKGELLKQIDHLQSQNNLHFKGKPDDSSTKIGQVIDRNGDWIEVIKQAKELTAGMNSVKPEEITKLVEVAVTYLGLIRQGLNSDEDKKFSSEAAAFVGNMTITTAKALEFHGLAHYRLLSHVGSLDNTIKSITEAFA